MSRMHAHALTMVAADGGVMPKYIFFCGLMQPEEHYTYFVDALLLYSTYVLRAVIKIPRMTSLVADL